MWNIKTTSKKLALQTLKAIPPMMLEVQHSRDSVENKLVSLIFVSLDMALNKMPPFLSG